MTQAILSPEASPGYRSETIDDGFIATLVDGGPALVGVILACTQLAVITWGIYGDIVSAFLVAESTRFVALTGMATAIIATASYMFGRFTEADLHVHEHVPAGQETGPCCASGQQDLTWPAEADQSEAHSPAPVSSTPANEGSPALRTRFFSEVANELRTPITSICLAARIIRKHHASTPEVVERFGETLVSDATRLGELVNEFLELVRLESGCVAWQDEDVPVLELMQTAESYLSELAQLQQRHICVHADGDLPPLNCDRERIVQVLTVLLSTTFGNTAESDTIGIYAFEHDGYTIFSIAPDNGDPVAFRRIVGSTTSTNTQQSQEAVAFAIPTLTFNICQEIIAHYGGYISADRRGDHTNVFRVALPQSRTQRRVDPEPLDHAAAEAVAALTPARPMVLADEDGDDTGHDNDFRFADESGSDLGDAPESPLASPHSDNEAIARQAPAAPPATRSTAAQESGFHCLSEEQAAELLALPATYADDAPANNNTPASDEDESSLADADQSVAAGTAADLACSEDAASPPSPESIDQDHDGAVLITPPPARRPLAAATAIPQLPAPRAAASTRGAGLPVVRTSAAAPEASRAARPPAVRDSSHTPVATAPAARSRRGTMIDPPVAGVRPDEDWHAEANHHPTHRSPAPWLAERLRKASASGVTTEHKPRLDDATTKPQPSASDERPDERRAIPTPPSRLRANGQKPPAANARAQAVPTSQMLHRRKLGS